MELIKLADFTYLSGSYMLFGLECGILTSYLFYIEESKLEKMSLFEIYLNLLSELCAMCVIIYFLTPLLHYIGSPMDGIYGFKRANDSVLNTSMLFIMAYLIGARSISDKVTAIINKLQIVNIKNKDTV